MSVEFFTFICEYISSVNRVIPREQGLYMWRANVLWNNDLHYFIDRYQKSTEDCKDKLKDNDMSSQIQFAISPAAGMDRLTDVQLNGLKESFSQTFHLLSELVSTDEDLLGARVWYFRDKRNRYFSVVVTVRKWIIIQRTRREYLFDYYRQYMQLLKLTRTNLYGYRFHRYWRTTDPAPRGKELVKSSTHLRFPNFQDVSVQ